MTAPTEEHTEWIQSIASRYSKEYGMPEEDVFQELYCQWLEATTDPGSKFSSYLVRGQDAKGMVLVSLGRWAAKWCKNETTHTGGVIGALGMPEVGNRVQSDAYYFSRWTLKEVLPLVESPEKWFGDDVSRFEDVHGAWLTLTEGERRLLKARFMTDVPTPYEELTAEFGADAAYLRKRVERALTRLQTTLGGLARRRRKDPASAVVGRRRAVSNAKALATQEHQWEGS